MMAEIREILKKLQVRMKAPAFRSGTDELTTSFWAVYSQEEVLDISTVSALYEMKTLPRIVIDNDTDK